MTSNNSDRSLRSVAVVIAAAGSGTRLGGVLPKAMELVAGRSLLAHTLTITAELPDLGFVAVAAPTTHVFEVEQTCAQVLVCPFVVVPGGATRSASVANALAALPPAIELVLVHDAARAFAPASVFLDVIAELIAGANAVVPGLPVVDTIKQVDADGAVLRTVERADLRGIQTPQGFDRETIDAVHANPADALATDDASMVEARGGAVRVIPGHQDAFKVTTSFDRLIAEALIRRRDSAD